MLAIEVLTDATSAPRFKRADLGRFLGVANIRRQFNDIATVSRSEITAGGVGPDYTLLQGQNDHDAFVDLEGALGVGGLQQQKSRGHDQPALQNLTTSSFP